MAEEVYRIDISVNFNDQYSREIKQAEREVSKFERSVERTEKRLERTSRSRWRITLDAVDRASRTIQRVGDFAERTARRSYRLTIGVVDFATRPLRAINRMATSTLGLLGAGAGIAGGIVWPTKLADDLITAQIAFETMLGSAQKANMFMEQVRQFAKDTPFGQAEVISLAQGLLVRGFRQNEVIPMLERIGNVTAAMGTGAEGIDRIIYALGQMRALGKVSAEEMNQLTEAGVKAWDYLAKGMGKSIKEVRKLSEDGKIQADEAIKHILAGMKEFDGMMQNVSNRTLRGLLSQIWDVFEADIFTKWGTGIQTEAVPALRRIRDWFDQNKDVVEEWGNAIEQAGRGVTRWVVDGIDRLQKRMSSLVNSEEWQMARGPFEKLSVAWDKVIAEPFEDWWKSDGEKIISRVFSGLGGGIGSFISSALGEDVNSEGNAFIEAGAVAGEKFKEGFLEKFQGKEIANRLLGMFRDIQPSFLGGQTESLLGSVLALMLDAWLLSKLGSILRVPGKIVKGGWDLGKTILGWFGLGKGKGQGPTSPAPSTRQLPTGHRVPIYGPHGDVISTVDVKRSSIPSRNMPGKSLSFFSDMPLGFAGRRIPIAGPLLDILSLAGTPQEALSGAIGGVGGGMAGSMIGAALGSMVLPGIGTTVGGMAGGMLGSFSGEKLGQKLWEMFNVDEVRQKIEESLFNREWWSNNWDTVQTWTKEKLFSGAWWSEQAGFVWGALEGTLFSSEWWQTQWENVKELTQSKWDEYTSVWESAKSKISETLFSKEWWSSKWETVKGWAADAWGGIKSTASNLVSSFLGGRERGLQTVRHAEGGLINRPHFGLVGEAGPEMIIPLSASRRSRALDLWMRTARYLGIRQYADGGMVPSRSLIEPILPASNRGNIIHINLGGISIQIQTEKVEKGNIKELADEIALEIAQKLTEAVGNMPVVSTN
jgi:tape measure domain-containing protein